MFLHYFTKKENNDQKIAKNAYLSIIECVKIIKNNSNLNIKEDFDSSFEIISIILIVIFYSYNNRPKYKNISQELMNLYINDLDKSLRESGIGDMSIGKYVKSYVKKFYFRVKKLEEIINKNSFQEFQKYLTKIKIQKNPTNINNLSNFLFLFINNLLKAAKKKDLSNIILKKLLI